MDPKFSVILRFQCTCIGILYGINHIWQFVGAHSIAGCLWRCINDLLDGTLSAGFLAFREASFLVEKINKLRKDRPDLSPLAVLVDGNGILHPKGKYFDIK